MREMLMALASGDKLVMMPQNFYAEAYTVGKDKETENDVIMTYPSNNTVKDEEVLLMLLDSEIQKKVINKEDYENETIIAFVEYFVDETGERYDGPLSTDLTCIDCGEKKIVREVVDDEPYYCYGCDSYKTNKEVK